MADEPRPRALRRRARWRRRKTGALVLLAPGALILALDLFRRIDFIRSYDQPHLLGWSATVAASFVFWAALLANAAVKRGVVRGAFAGAFVVLFSITTSVQHAYFSYFNTYLSHDGQIFSRSLPAAIFGHLPWMRTGLWWAFPLALLTSLALVYAARRYTKPKKWFRRLGWAAGLLVLVAVTRIPASYRMWQSTSPDIIYVHGYVSLIKERMGYSFHADEVRSQRRHPPSLPSVTAKPKKKRNVLFILHESLRGDITCNTYPQDGEPCVTPFSSKAAPNRMPLLQLRANASTTAISISNLWTGIPGHSGLDALLEAPTLWDYAKAAGYKTAYWTSQHVMFQSMRLYVQDFPLDQHAYATHLDRKANFDAGAFDSLLTDWVIDHVDKLEEPYFAVVHYSNVHYPYVYHPDYAPFQPVSRSRSSKDNAEHYNYYKNVAYYSDLAVGRLVDHFRKNDHDNKQKDTVIVYTSDHGEAFREHWQLGHTSALFDEELHVPGWIDAPAGTLDVDEQKAVVAAKNDYVFHYDLPATMLDLMGLWDTPEFQPYIKKMVGKPLTRGTKNRGPVPISNCSWLWQCGFPGWGMMEGSMKVEARMWDYEFHCFDLSVDPEERNNLGEAACGPLAQIARTTFGPMPVAEWPNPRLQLWGPPKPKEERE